MFSFSCFHTHIQGKKPKNALEPSAEATVKNATQDGSQNQVSKDSSVPSNDGSPILVGDPRPSEEDVEEITKTLLSACTSASSLISCDDLHALGMKDETESVYANTINGETLARENHRVTKGMESAKAYISSLSASAIEAQLPNHELHVIPHFRMFENLEVPNLSGNAIGDLPPRLHSLNLSKNNISTIEGLRKLTRLRVLDLSYNQIRRIGHGLASCLSLKELYLTGNKISEVEGLHRLWQLRILDIRFNEISSAKCLGQLAPNYNSLQAISLDGNPTQNSAGDEQLKKYLLAILPCLVYYNGQPIKVSTDHSIKLGITSHQIHRVLRLNDKALRKGSRGGGPAQRPSDTSTNAYKGKTVNSSKLSKGKYHATHLPPNEAEFSCRIRRKRFWFLIFT
ncbi:hypothetical protein RJT34_31176 [Clitoria ternatea]|uniref:Uncharacterized protein n=1 Tax=Clitoria ternatea TaxID=43366 RepID=A0AAN9EV11_CLITE